MSEGIVIALITTFGGAAVGAITSSLTTYRKLQRGVMCSLGSDIRRDCNEAIDKGRISLIELRRINENNDVYHSLGGNGHVKALIARINTLPIQDD